MIEDIEGLGQIVSDISKDSLSVSEVVYISECVEGFNPSALVDRIDELSPYQPPKGIDSTNELSDIIEPVKDQIDSKYLEAPSDIEQIKEIGEYLSSVENLSFDNWSQLSSYQRLETLQMTENKIAEIEHREPCKVKAVYMEPNHFGYYSTSDKTITVNTIYLDDKSFDAYKNTLDTLVHEGRHAYQDYNMTEREVHPRGGEVNMWKWNENEIGYQTVSLYGFEAYAMQPVETDARAFAEDVLNNYFEKTA